jgi:hypothetical protein
MLQDGFYVTAAPLPKKIWTFEQAATRLLADNQKFLHIPPGCQHPVGEWELTCFPVEKYVNVVLNEAHVRFLRNMVEEFLSFRDRRGKYYARKGLADLMQKTLLYPPYPFDVGGLSMKAWAIEMFWNKKSFHEHPR